MPQQNQSGNPRLKNNLLAMIILMKRKAENKGLDPVIPVAKVIDMLRSSGMHITYQQLAELTKDPTIAPFISAINKNQITINMGTEETEPEPVALSQPTPSANASPEMGGDFGGDDMGDEFNPEEEEAPINDEEDFMAGSKARPRPSIVTSMAKRAAARRD